MRIIQIAAASETITASDICDRLSDEPRTIVYRHKHWNATGACCGNEYQKIGGFRKRG